MAISLAGLDPEVRLYAEAALSSARHYGIPVTVTSTRRNWAQQEQLRAQWLQCVQRGDAYNPDPAKRCRYPANEPGDSAHNYGLAWDSVTDTPYQAAWNFIRSWHGWGIPQNDIIHAEVKGWRRFRNGWQGQVG